MSETSDEQPGADRLRKRDPGPDLRKRDPAADVPPGWSPEQPPAAPGWSPVQPPAAPGWSPAQPPGAPGWGPPPPPAPGYPGYGPAAAPGGYGADGRPPPGPGWGAPGWGAPPGWGPPPPPKPGVVPLRPLGVGELLDGAISSIRAHPRTMLGLSAIVAVITQLIQVPVTWLLLRGSVDLASTGPTTETEDVAVAVGTFSTLGITILVTLIATLVLTGVLTVVMSRAVLGESITAGQAWAAVRPRLLTLLGTTSLTFIAVGIVLMLGLVPGAVLGAAGLPAGLWGTALTLGLIASALGAIYLYVALALAPPAVVLERHGMIGALRRSRQLVTGAWWRTCGLLVLINVIAQAIAGILSVPFLVLSVIASYLGPGAADPYTLLPLVIGGIGTVLASAVTWPFTAAATVLIYVDRRMRREGLDLELQRAAGGGTQATPADGPAGPAGSAGPAGPAGPTGAEGPTGFIPGQW